MKVSFPARRYHNVLIPETDGGREAFGTIKDGAQVLVDVRTVRSVRQLNLYWALMTLLADNCDDFASKESASDIIKIDCGEVNYFLHPKTGEIFGSPRSIAFESMPQDRFNRFMNRVLWVIESKYLPDSSEALRKEMYRMVDSEPTMRDAA